MRAVASCLVAVLAAWVLRFGDPRTNGKGWKEIETFASSSACEEERQERAREVRDKAQTVPTLERVLSFYRCEEVKDATGDAAPPRSRGSKARP